MERFEKAVSYSAVPGKYRRGERYSFYGLGLKDKEDPEKLLGPEIWPMLGSKKACLRFLSGYCDGLVTFHLLSLTQAYHRPLLSANL